jgi:hypothetical protein
MLMMLLHGKHVLLIAGAALQQHVLQRFYCKECTPNSFAWLLTRASHNAAALAVLLALLVHRIPCCAACFVLAFVTYRLPDNNSCWTPACCVRTGSKLHMESRRQSGSSGASRGKCKRDRHHQQHCDSHGQPEPHRRRQPPDRCNNTSWGTCTSVIRHSGSQLHTQTGVGLALSSCNFIAGSNCLQTQQQRPPRLAYAFTARPPPFHALRVRVFFAVLNVVLYTCNLYLQAPFTITKTGPTAPVPAGQVFSYSIVVTFLGPSRGVKIQDVLPTQVTPAGASSWRSRRSNSTTREVENYTQLLMACQGDISSCRAEASLHACCLQCC